MCGHKCNACRRQEEIESENPYFLIMGVGAAPQGFNLGGCQQGILIMHACIINVLLLTVSKRTLIMHTCIINVLLLTTPQVKNLVRRWISSTTPLIKKWGPRTFLEPSGTKWNQSRHQALKRHFLKFHCLTPPFIIILNKSRGSRNQTPRATEYK